MATATGEATACLTSLRLNESRAIECHRDICSDLLSLG